MTTDRGKSRRMKLGNAAEGLGEDAEQAMLARLQKWLRENWQVAKVTLDETERKQNYVTVKLEQHISITHTMNEQLLDEFPGTSTNSYAGGLKMRVPYRADHSDLRSAAALAASALATRPRDAGPLMIGLGLLLAVAALILLANVLRTWVSS
jgi:hypothetical protein